MALLLIDTHEFAILNDKSQMRNDKLEIANFELRNWEPARRVGVRRTISNLKKHRAKSKETGVRAQVSVFSFFLFS
jgi:hypothetical protein